MAIKISIANTSRDYLTFGSANTPTAAQIAGNDDATSSGHLEFYTTSSGSSVERMRIDSSGNVGIGTNAPTTKLDVTGDVNVTGALTVAAGAANINLAANALLVGRSTGDEGGEILLNKSVTNNSLTGSGITIDSFQNKIRFFEQGGAARGAYIDLTACAGGVGTNLISGGSGTVNSGTGAKLAYYASTGTTIDEANKLAALKG